MALKRSPFGVDVYLESDMARGWYALGNGRLMMREGHSHQELVAALRRELRRYNEARDKLSPDGLARAVRLTHNGFPVLFWSVDPRIEAEASTIENGSIEHLVYPGHPLHPETSTVKKRARRAKKGAKTDAK